MSTMKIGIDSRMMFYRIQSKGIFHRRKYLQDTPEIIKDYAEGRREHGTQEKTTEIVIFSAGRPPTSNWKS